LTVNAKRGGVSDNHLAEIRAAGYDDADIAAIVAHVALNVLTNYFNRVAQPVIDFPEVTPRMAEAAVAVTKAGLRPHRCRPAMRRLTCSSTLRSKRCRAVRRGGNEPLIARRRRPERRDPRGAKP